ncbi:hypothetical protein E2C01_071429 [Portunus trituberculatus]|uniref:Uncharacterized protein n=1 Tax=Portunus trituberculatus TaxID=210409 RepID=A0A5B7HZY4_PORTR|nr:hypothetical protein [Portunus trituberculatus]
MCCIATMSWPAVYSDGIKKKKRIPINLGIGTSHGSPHRAQHKWSAVHRTVVAVGEVGKRLHS